MRGDDVSTIERETGLDEERIERLIEKEGWDALRGERRAAELAGDQAAGDKFIALADVVRALAAQVAAKAKSDGLKAKDVLDLAKAVELAQKIRRAEVVFADRRAHKLR